MSHTWLQKGLNVGTLATALVLTSPCLFAAGFQLHEQSTTYLGTAFSGTASTAEDASTAYYNAAGLTELKNAQVVASGIYIHGNIKLYDAVARNNVGATVVADPTNKPSGTAFVPGLFVNANINKKWSVGFGISAPFGLSTKYDAQSIARYMATTSKINTANFMPAIAYKINDKFSIGAAFNAVKMNAQISSAINFTGEGYVQNYGSCWTFGYNVGVLYKPSTETKMGLVYFSGYNPHIKGHVDSFRYPSATPPTTLRSDIKLPDRLVYSITHAYSEKWTAVGDVEFVHWSRLSQLRINYNTGTVATEPLYYKNTWRLALGANYQYSNPLMFKAGLAFDQTPVQTRLRSARLPDNDRFWLAIGAKYKVTKHIAIDVAYAHLFFKKSPISQVGTDPGNTAKSLYGNYKSSADLVGLQLTWNFV